MDDFPEFETYADVIDAYERDNMGYATLTDYIKGENIKIKEIDISPLSDLEKLKNGGAVGIEVLFTEKMKDGGRVGLFMGGSPLEGQALSIYNSMNAYGFSDQEIANALQERGLYTPPGSDSGTTTSPQTIQPIGTRDDGQDRTFVDRQDYSFNKKNYAPGKKLEVNPAAFGISFEKASPPQGIINQAIEMPGRTLTSFASPTTGGNITGPAEEGFMSQVVDIDPAGRTREELRQQYDRYNRFFGAPSNFAAARTPGKAGQVLGSVVGAASGIPLLGPGIEALSKMGGGDRGLQSKYTVDNVGFGNTGARDEFGLATFDKKDGFLGLTGNTTRDYVDRMNERLEELDDFFGSRIEDFDINNLTPDMLSQMSKINSTYAKQLQAYKQRTAVEEINKKTKAAIEAEKEKEKQKQIELQKKIEKEAAAGKSLSQIGQENFTGEGMAFQAGKTDQGGGVTKGKVQKSSSVPGGYYGSPRKDGGLMFARGGLASMFRNKR